MTMHMHYFVNETVKLSRHFLAVGLCTPGKVPASCKLAFQNCNNGSLNCTSFVSSETEQFHSLSHIYIQGTTSNFCKNACFSSVICWHTTDCMLNRARQVNLRPVKIL